MIQYEQAGVCRGDRIMKKLWLFIFLICASTAWADNDFTDTIDLKPARIVNISVGTVGVGRMTPLLWRYGDELAKR